MKFLAIVLALLALPANAAVYRYTSAEFDTFGASAGSAYVCPLAINYTCKEDFGVGMRLTATFRLDGPLPINSTFEVPWADHISVGLSPRSYFGFAASSIFVTTNSAGVVIGAGVDAYPWPSQDYETASGGMNWAQATYTREFAYTCERHGHCIDIEHRTASTSGQGTIEIISPVPLPASGSVLLAGLGALILRRSLQRTL